MKIRVSGRKNEIICEKVYIIFALGILFQFRYQQLPTLLSVLFEIYFN